MENAVFLTSLESGVPEGYDRLYYGEEFCQELMPTKREVEEALEISLKERLEFTLVTPYVTESGLKKIKKILGVLPEGTEVVCNDLGVLWELKNYNLEPVMGRLLLRFRRDPRIPKVEKKLPKAAIDHLHVSGMTQPRVKRMELDNTPFPVEHGLSKNLRGSIYLPYVYLTTSRYCPTDAYVSGKFRISHCKKACLNYHFVLEHKDFPNRLLQIGNTIFYENDRIRPQKGVDRLVYLKGLKDRLDSQIADNNRPKEE